MHPTSGDTRISRSYFWWRRTTGADYEGYGYVGERWWDLGQPVADGAGSSLGARRDAKLGQDVRDVGFGGAGADEEGLGDLGIGPARGHEPKHLPLPGRQLGAVSVGSLPRPGPFGGHQHALHL